MQTFTAFEYLLIDAANHFGLDKELFEVRIDWALNRIDSLEDYADQAPDKTRPLYIKAVQAIRKAQRGEPTGHLVGLDAICSGIQVLSTLSGCVAGADATGLVDPNRRADAYTDVTTAMGQVMKGEFVVDRGEVKDATMTACYGSKAVPEEIFGEDTPELAAFYEGAMRVAPGAFTLLQELKDTWQPFALCHSWVLPDNFHAHIKVMEDMESRVEVDELDHATFTYYYKENQGKERGVSNVANVTHSIDAYVLRSLIRRCSYDPMEAQFAMECVYARLLECDIYDVGPHPIEDAPEEIQRYVERFESTQMADAVIIPYLDEDTVRFLTEEHLRRLNRMLDRMLSHKPFHIVSVHDEFKCHPNHMNRLRECYIEIFAEMAEADILSDIFQQLLGVQGTYQKLSSDLGDKIRLSNYPIC